MATIAIVDKAPSAVNYSRYFNFEFDNYHLSSKKVKKLLKKDVDLEFDADSYEYVILIGSEASKFIGGIGSVTEFAGHLVDDKFIPMINPAMLSFKPEAKPLFDRACEKLHNYVSGEKPPTVTGDFEGIECSSDSFFNTSASVLAAPVPVSFPVGVSPR